MLGLGTGLTTFQQKGDAPVITATSLPLMTALDETMTPAQGHVAGSYASTAGTITGTVVSYVVNGAAQPGSHDLQPGDSVRAQVLVSDSAGNSRQFQTATVTVGIIAPAAAFGLARMVAGYAGPVLRVVRASDAAQADIGLGPDGGLDVAAAVAFQGASTLTVSVWYDQTGGARHLTQPTAGSRPTLWLGDGGPVITSYGTSKPLLIPASLMLQRQDNAVLLAARTPGLGATSAYFMWGDAANLDYGLTTPRSAGQRALQPMVAGASILSGATQKAANAVANMSLIGLVSSAGGMVLHRDGASCAYPAAGAMLLDKGGQLGAGFSYAGRLDLRAFVVYPVALSEASMAIAKAGLAQRTGPVAAVDRGLLATGDSLVFGTGGVNNRTLTAALEPLAPTTLMRNTGVAGERLSGNYTAFASGGDRYVVAGVQNVFVADYGHNDIKGHMDEGMAGPAVLTQMQGHLRALCADLRAAGYDRIIWQECLPDASAGWTAAMEAVRDDWNTWLATGPLDVNGVPCLNGLDLVASDAGFVLSNAETDAGRGMAQLTLSSDRIHPNEETAPARAAHLLAAIEAALPTPLSIGGTPLTTATAGVAWPGFAVSASFGTAPYSWTLTGAWPAGASFDGTTWGVTFGTAGTVAGLSVRVTDALGAVANLPEFSVTVAAASAGLVVQGVTTSDATSDATTLLVALPATVAAGDLLLALVASDAISTLTWDNATAGTWTQQFNDIGPSNTCRLMAFSRMATGTEGGATLSIGISAAQQAVAQVYRVSGAEGGISVSGTGARGTGTAPDPAPVTAAWGAAANLFIATVSKDNSADLTGAPAGYGDLRSRTSSGAGQATLASAVKAANAASDDPGSFASATSGGWVCATFALRPA